MVLLLLSKVTQKHFRHSASKVHCALPRAQHGICSSIPCWCSLILSRTQRIARARNTLFMWTISSLARIFPYATSNEFLVATASATSFLSSAVMYLWGAVIIYPTMWHITMILKIHPLKKSLHLVGSEEVEKGPKSSKIFSPQLVGGENGENINTY